MGETTREAEALRAALRQALAALEAWERWEAGVIQDAACWAPDGMAEFPTLTAPHFDALVPGLQLERRAAKAAAAAALRGDRP